MVKGHLTWDNSVIHDVYNPVMNTKILKSFNHKHNIHVSSKNFEANGYKQI